MFREVNERLAELASKRDGVTDYLCECSRVDCKAVVPLTLEEYEGVRSSSNLFVIAPGHEVLDVDNMVRTTREYSLVEKKRGWEELAHETDPRSRGPEAA